MADITDKITLNMIGKVLAIGGSIFFICSFFAKLQMQVSLNTEAITKAVERLEDINTRVSILEVKDK